MSGIGIVGAGAFGTALGIAFAKDGREVTLWARSAEHTQDMQKTDTNLARLPGFAFPESLQIAPNLDALSGCEAILLAVPLQRLDEFLRGSARALNGLTLINCSKGIDLRTHQRGSEIMVQHCSDSLVAVLTGPSFAVDIAAGLPTALTLACEDEVVLARLQRLLATSTIRLYSSPDVLGAELGGAMKNVVALAAGMTIGAGFGESARAAIIARGFAEMQRMAARLGADPQTLGGMSGLGDLVLTCTSAKSRNFSAGLAFGQGKAPDTGKTIEGIATSRAINELARKNSIDMPLVSAVADIVSGDLTIEAAKDVLLARPLRKES